jgi:hypothetical protein
VGKKHAHAEGHPAGDDWRKAAAVRVRMYRHGLGDCFLLTFPRARGRDFQVLIDCGVILGTPDGDAVIRRVVEDLKAATDHDGTPTLDVLVATHEHWDHLSGFAAARDEFKGFDIGQVWMAWTEDPDDHTAKQLRKERAAGVKALRLGVAHLEAHLAATGALGAAAEDFGRVAEVLAFFGPDTAAGDDLGAAAKAKARTLGVTDAMDWCRTHAGAKFWKPGDLIEPKGVKGLRVYVLGPPTDRAQLFKDLPTRSGHETYGLAGDRLGAAGRVFFGADVGQPAPDRTRGEFDRAAPFDPKYRIGMDRAAADDFFRTHYLGSGPDDPDGWRRIDGLGLGGAAAFALQLDSDTNNTSLALAFELADGRALLFPADAQVGNWESWHADARGKPRTWDVDGKEVTARDLLGRTVVYKCGHHGSHNATLRAKGLEMMTDGRLVALVPVDTYIAHEKKHWGKMPFDPLMAALRKRTQGRVIVADRPVADLPAGTFPPGQVVDAAERIEVAGPRDKPVRRPLYVDYFVPTT